MISRTGNDNWDGAHYLDRKTREQCHVQGGERHEG